MAMFGNMSPQERLAFGQMMLGLGAGFLGPGTQQQRLQRGLTQGAAQGLAGTQVGGRQALIGAQLEDLERQRETQEAVRQAVLNRYNLPPMQSPVGTPGINPMQSPMPPPGAIADPYEAQLVDIVRAGGPVEPLMNYQAQQMTPQNPLMEVDGNLYNRQTGEWIQPPGAGEPDQEERFKQGKDLRSEFRAVTQDFAKQNDAFGRIIASAEEPSAAGDLALIFNYMKLLDPGSVVREGEFANAENAGGIPQRVRAQYNKIMRGERLAEEQRTDFVDRSVRLYERASDDFDKRRGEYSGLAERYGVSPENVVLNRALYLPEDYQHLLMQQTMPEESQQAEPSIDDLVNMYTQGQ